MNTKDVLGITLFRLASTRQLAPPLLFLIDTLEL